MTIARAMVAGVRAPFAQWRLCLALWAARLVPAVLAVGLPVFAAARDDLGLHPDAAALIDPASDTTGLAYAWRSDAGHGALAGIPDAMFWLVILTWLGTTVLLGGITARLVHGRPRTSAFGAECGRYAGRFLRLGLFALLLAYVLDVGINGVLEAVHDERGRAAFTQDHAIEKGWARGLLYLAVLHVLGIVHACARVDIVLAERRSVLLSWVRGLGMLLAHLPALVVVELGMLVVVGAAVGLDYLVTGRIAAPGAGASWAGIGVFLGLSALLSYLRTGVEVGTLAARCVVVVPERAPPEPSRDETLEDPLDDEPDLAIS